MRACLDGFLANEDKAAGRLKRGGGVTITGVDFARFDADLAAHARSDEPDPERWFHSRVVRGPVRRRRGSACASAATPRATAPAFTLFVAF